MTVSSRTTTDPFTVPLIINGKDVNTNSTFEVFSSQKGQTIWNSSSASVSEALNAADGAARAFPAWSTTKPKIRRNIFLKAADLLESRREEFEQYMMQETSALAAFTNFNVQFAAEMLRDVAGRITTCLTGSLPVCQEEGAHALVLKEPYGVILGIAPWNAPYALGFRAAAFALAAGNTCVLKGSELSPRCFWAIGSLFRQAGLPDGCLNVIYSRPQDAAAVTTALIEHTAIKKINFTGSTAVGGIIATTASKNLKPVLMELGGKSSAIVCEDADIDKAAKQCALGAFLHAGQICMSTERILVHKSILRPFTEALKAAIRDITSSTSETQVLAQPVGHQKVQTLVSDAIAKGAELVHGQSDGEQSSMKPIVLGGVTDQMNIYQIETFGPSVSLIAINDEEEGIRIANDTEYGLSGAVFTEDLAKGLSIAKRIETGAVHINHMTVHDDPVLPHGGIKNSGWGRFNGETGLNEFLKTKTITFQM